MSPYPQLKGPHARVHIPNSRGHTQSITCGLLVVFTVQANSNNNKTCHNPPLQRDCIEQHNNAIQYMPYLKGAIPPQFGTIAVVPTGSSKRCAPLKRALGPTVSLATSLFRPTTTATSCRG